MNRERYEEELEQENNESVEEVTPTVEESNNNYHEKGEYYFIQHVNKEDKKEFNLFLFDTKRANSKSNIILSVFTIAFGAWMIYEKSYVFGGIFIALAVFMLFFSKAISRRMLVRTAERKLTDEVLEVGVDITDDGIDYSLVDEAPRPKLEWSLFQHSYENDRYLFLEINAVSIVIIKKEECPYLPQIREIILEKINNHKYLNK